MCFPTSFWGLKLKVSPDPVEIPDFPLGVTQDNPLMGMIQNKFQHLFIFIDFLFYWRKKDLVLLFHLAYYKYEKKNDPMAFLLYRVSSKRLKSQEKN